MAVLHDVLNNSDYMLDLCADKSLTMADLDSSSVFICRC
ncbi:hypothetical protein HMPREF2087_01672 [Helicobacter canis NCTC 12740]|uniref:Uncharacterized protein n=1 Tax=Helicobacter canis NCTC 12740 TaxID=1357399 RepID=V8CEP8_9HELI|nr:hypothetical protein HMPREF2087_01672 [Helicobacter canis NCTC 12740]